MPERLAAVDVADVHLDQRFGEHRARVAQGYRRVRQRAGVEHDRQARVGGLVQPAQQLALVLALAHLDVEAELGAAAGAQRHQFGVGRVPVDIGLARALAWGIMREESSFVADVRSHSNAIGLMQLIGPTAKWVATGTALPFDDASLKRPDVSIELGVRLLSKLRASHVHPALAIAAYNGGSGSVERWVKAHLADDLDLFVEQIPFEETRNYVKRVLASEAAYAYLYDPAALDETLALPLRMPR